MVLNCFNWPNLNCFPNLFRIDRYKKGSTLSYKHLHLKAWKRCEILFTVNFTMWKKYKHLTSWTAPCLLLSHRLHLEQEAGAEMWIIIITELVFIYICINFTADTFYICHTIIWFYSEQMMRVLSIEGALHT